jgi:hypothetical protein
MTQRAFAEHVGFSRSTISLWERCPARMNVGAAREVARVAGGRLSIDQDGQLDFLSPPETELLGCFGKLDRDRATAVLESTLMLAAGKSYQEITDFMFERTGVRVHLS